MPNVALMIGAGLIGALVAGLFLLYNEEGFSNHNRQSYSDYSSSGRGSSNGPNSGRGSNYSSQTRYHERYDTPINGRRRRRRNEEDEPNCLICCDEMTKCVYTISCCKQKFHIRCLQNWIKTILSGSNPDLRVPNCPHCREVLRNPQSILRLAA